MLLNLWRWDTSVARKTRRPGGPAAFEEVAALRKHLDAAGADEKKPIQSAIDALNTDRQFLAWSPTRVERGFHDPERFGIVEFVLKP